MDRADNGNGGGVGVYMRVSGEDQKKRKTIENQRPDLDRYLAAYNLTPYGWYEDEAISGKWVPFGERPQGRRLLADAQAGHVTLVLVWRLDRFGRNAYEILGAVRQLEEAGARLVSFKEQFDTRTAAGRLQLGVLASIAEFEWESIMERTEAGIERRLGDGGWMGGMCPYGYRIEGKGTRAARTVPDETPLGLAEYPQLTPAGVVRLVFQLTVEGNLSTIAVADELNRRGVPTAFALRGRMRKHGEQTGPTMAVWRANAVSVLLGNPAYKGAYTFGRKPRNHHGNGNGTRRAIVTCPVPPLVSDETWDAAQAAIKRHLALSPRNAKRDYLLRGLMRCGACGHAYVGEHARYVCVAARHPTILFGRDLGTERRCRRALPLRAAPLEAKVWAEVEAWARDPERVRGLLSIKLMAKTADAELLRVDLATRQQERDAKQAERDSVVALYRKGRIDERDLDRQLDDIAGEERALVAQIGQLSDQLATLDNVSAKLDAIDAQLRALRVRLDTEPLTPALQRSVIETLVEEIVVLTEPDEQGTERGVAHVFYCFDPPISPDATPPDGGIAPNSLGISLSNLPWMIHS